MGIRAAMTLIVEQTEAVTPTTASHDSFTFHARTDEAQTVAFADWVKQGTAVLRRCDLSLVTLPADDGEAQPQTVSKRLRATFALTVYYHIGQAGGLVDVQIMASEDVESLARRLGDPSNWDRPTSGIEAITFLDEQPTLTVAQGGYALLALRFRVLYRE